MPSTYAHARFGKEARVMLPEPLQRSIQRFPQLFDLGVQGPDFFFYYQPLFKTQLGALGTWYHELSGQEFFRRATEQYAAAPSEGAMVYLYGVLCHYALDSRSHGLVYQVTEQGCPGHTELEVELDRVLLARDGVAEPHRKNLCHHLRLTWGECATIAPFYPPVTAYAIRRSVRIMAAAGWLLSRKNRELLQSLFRLGGQTPGQMVMYSRPNRRCAAYLPELERCYAQALERFPEMAQQLAQYMERGTPLGEDFRLNFNGRE